LTNDLKGISFHTKHMNKFPKARIWGGVDSDGTDTHKVYCPSCGVEIARGRFVVTIELGSGGEVKRLLLLRKAPAFHCGQLIAVPRFFYCLEEAKPALESVEERLGRSKGDLGKLGLDFALYKGRPAA
jgi:hypothetical protein